MWAKADSLQTQLVLCDRPEGADGVKSRAAIKSILTHVPVSSSRVKVVWRMEFYGNFGGSI